MSIKAKFWRGTPREFIRGQVVQGGADAFNYEEISIPTNPANSVAILIHRVEFELEDADHTLCVADGADISVGLSKQQPSAEEHLNDKNVLVKKKFSYTSGATNNAGGIFNNIMVEDFYPHPIVASGDSLYLWVDTTSVGTVTINIRIHYTLARIPMAMYTRALIATI